MEFLSTQLHSLLSSEE
ncbi:unnamed protein product [Staurois parvus]|uniref:Uncharacterized protein n=1 Tax=Staurois parvus TaxID=386267 RepID=A0ABN9BL09_9NEOB|nr:unnamed protein product [Staurois parvus]